MIVGPLPLADVDKVWPTIAVWMDKACKRGRGSMTAWNIYEGCRNGSMLLFVDWSNEQICAAIIGKVRTTPEGQVLSIEAAGGTEMRRWLPELHSIEWLKTMGITLVDFEGRKGWERVVKGVSVIRQVYRLSLEPIPVPSEVDIVNNLR